MKKTSKLLAFAVVFSILASTIVMPIGVSAAGATNLVVNGDFEQGFDAVSVTGGSVAKTTHGTVTDVMFDGSGTITEESSNAANKAIKITLNDSAKATDSNGKYIVEFVSITAPTSTGYYYAAAKAMAAENPTSAECLMRSTWNYCTNSCRNNMTTDSWTKFETVFNANGGTKVYLQVSSNNEKMSYSHYMDDLELYKLELDKDGATDVAASGSFKLSGPEALDLTVDGITITDGTSSVNPTAVAYADGEWTISYSGLSSLTAYTLKITSVMGYSAADTVAPTYTFTTKDSNLVANGGFENLSEGALSTTAAIGVTGSAEVVGSAVTAPHGGEKCVLVNCTNGTYGGLRFISIPVGYDNPCRFTMYAKLKEAPASGSVTTRALVEQKSFLLRSEPVVLSATEWTPITFDFAINSADVSDRNFVHVGFTTLSGGVSEVYVDDYSLVPISQPEFTASYSITDGETDVPLSTTVTVEFTNPATYKNGNNLETTLTSSQFAIDNGASIGTVTKVSPTKYTVELSGLANDTTYTLGLNGVRDTFGQAADEDVTFTTVAAAAPPATPQPLENLLAATATFTYSDSGLWNDATQFSYVTPVDGIYSLTATNGTDTTKGFRIINIPENVNTDYIISAYVKDGKDDGNSPVIKSLHNGHTCLAATTENIDAANVTIGSEWTKVSYVVRVSDKGTHTTDSTLCKNHSGKGAIIGTADGATYQGVMHMGFNFTSAAGDVLLVKDFTMKQYLPFEITSSVEDGASGVDTDTDITLEFTNKPYQLEADTHVVLKKNGSPVTGKMTLIPVSDTVYTVSLSGLEGGAAYTLGLEGVQDMYAQEADFEIAFATTVAFNILKSNGYDFSFENGTNPEKEGSPVFEIVTKDSNNLPEAVDGTKYLKATNMQGGKVRFNYIGQGQTVQLEAGKTYEISYYARTVLDVQTGGSDEGTAQIYVSIAGPADNTVYPTNVKAPVFDIKGNAWTKVTGTVTIAEASPALDSRYDANATRVYRGIHIGTATSTSDIYFDKFEIKEYIPEFSMTTTPVGGATSVYADTVTLEFSNAPVNVTTDNVSITGGSATVNSVSKVSDTVYAISFDGFDYNTTYTVSISNVADSYGQLVSGETTFTTGKGNVADDYNIVAGTGSNNGFENVALGAYTGHSNVDGYGEGAVNGSEIYTVVDEAGESIAPYEGTKMLKIAANGDTNTTSHRLNNVKRGFEIGKTYQASFYARTVKEGETVNGTVFTSRTGVTTNLINIERLAGAAATITNEWTRVSATFKVIENADLTKTNPTNDGLHIGVNVNGTDIYIDNYEIMEVPEDELGIVSSTPGNNADGVEIAVGKLILNYSMPLAQGFNPAADGVIKLYKGETDVTDELVTGVTTGFSNGSIEVAVDELDNGTQYRVVATGAEDILGRTTEAETVVFTTKTAISTLGSVVLDASGNPLDIEAAAAADVKGATINVANASSGSIPMPLYIYTVYNADGSLYKAGTTTFTGELALGANTDLTHNFDGIDLSGKILTLYLVNSYKSLVLAAEPIVMDYTQP